MSPTRLASPSKLVQLACVWLLHLSVSAVHAQEPNPVGPTEAFAGVSNPHSDAVLPPIAASEDSSSACVPPVAAQGVPAPPSDPQPSAADASPKTAAFELTKPWRPKHFPRLYTPRSAHTHPSDTTEGWDRSPTQEEDTTRDGPSTRRHNGLLIGGITTWAISYLITGIGGGVWAAMHAEECRVGEITKGCNQEGLLLIPLVGPLLAGDLGGAAKAFFSATQFLGLALTIAGVFRYRQPSATRSSFAARSFGEHPTFEVQPLPGGALLRTRLTF